MKTRTVLTSADELLNQWQAAWPTALDIWSRYTRLQPAMLCKTQLEAAKEGLNGSFAMIRFADQRIVIDMEGVQRYQLQDYAVEILAHEIGHHVLAPANATDQLRLLARMRRALPTLHQHAPMLANLYTDLLINDRLQRQSELRLADIYQNLHEVHGQVTTVGVWALYMRIYEQLWQLPKGQLCRAELDARAETDAWLGARLIRVYARDWLDGAGRFAALMLPYVVEDNEKQQAAMASLHDLASANKECLPGGLHEVEEGEADGAIHPAEDPLITGMDQAEPTNENNQPVQDKQQKTQHSAGQAREPFEYGELLRASGIELSDHEIAVRYYRERALPYLIPYPKKRMPKGKELLLEGLDAWSSGDPLDELDWLQSVMQSPRVIPGVTTVKRQYGEQPGQQKTFDPIDLDIYVDSSGSMPNPQYAMSYLTLAGAIIAISALRAGARVQVTLWSGKEEFIQTSGFVRDEEAILKVLTGFFGGATAFPIHSLRKTYLEGRSAQEREARTTHLLMISDDGITTMFDQDEKGHSGWDISARALMAAKGGGTMVLNLHEAIFASQTSKVPYYTEIREALNRAVQEQDWRLHRITEWESLIEFARDFSKRYAQR